MKKFIAVGLIIVIVLSVTGCSKRTVSEIYEVDNGSLSSDTFNHTNVISYDTVFTQELPSGQTKTMELNGETVTLTYERTNYYPSHSRKVHKYLIDGTDDDYVLFNEDGSVYKIARYPITTIEISKTDSAETVQAALEPALAHLVDLSKYEYVDVSKRGDESDFRSYNFLFRNKKFGYVTDFTKVDVTSDGIVESLSINDLVMNVDEYCTNIDKTVEEELIEERLKSIYDTGTTEYRSCTLIDEPNFVVYENELYVEYDFTCQVYHSEEKRERPDGCKLLIPVELLSGN